jgi:hypothetical protein
MTILKSRNTTTTTITTIDAAAPSHKRTINNKRIKLIVGFLILVLVSSSLFILALSVLPVPSLAANSAMTVGDNNSIKITKQESFRDSNGRINIIGVVDNNGKIPVSITIGLNVVDNKKNNNAESVTTMTDPTYGKIIYPLTGAPFKFVIDPNQSVKGTAFISSIKQVPVPYYNVLRLNYSNMPTGSDRALVGTAKNVGPFDLHDVSVYASVHDKNGIQIDSVKSNVMSVIKPGQEVAFTAIPDSAISPHVFYFSCAGVSLNNAPMTILDIGKGQSISYDINGVVSISDFKYNAATDSIVFGVKHYNPDGGPMSLKIVRNSGNTSSAVSIVMDGKLYKEASLKTMDSKTVHIDLFIPSGEHNVQVKGIRNDAA